MVKIFALPVKALFTGKPVKQFYRFLPVKMHNSKCNDVIAELFSVFQLCTLSLKGLCTHNLRNRKQSVYRPTTYVGRIFGILGLHKY